MYETTQNDLIRQKWDICSANREKILSLYSGQIMQKTTQNEFIRQKWDIFLRKPREANNASNDSKWANSSKMRSFAIQIEEGTISYCQANNAKNDSKWANSSKMRSFAMQTEEGSIS